MAFFEIGGTPFDVINISEDEVKVYGDEARTYTGRLRSNVSAVKRIWNVVINEMSQSQYLSLRTMVETAAQIVVSGDAFTSEGPYTCRIYLTDGDYIRNKASFLRGVRLRLEQV